MSRAKNQKIIPIILIIIITITILLNLSKNYSYFFPHEIVKENNVIVSGNVEDLNVEGSTAHNKIYGNRAADYKVTGSSSFDTLYNTFYMEGFKPYTSYDATVTLNFEDIDNVLDDMAIGFIDYEPQSFVSNGVQTTNITTIDENGLPKFVNLKVVRGSNQYIIETQFTANMDGGTWMVVGLTPKVSQELEYEIKNIKVKFDEVK